MLKGAFMLKIATKLLTAVILTTLLSQVSYAQNQLSVGLQVKEQVKLSLWYDGLNEMVDPHTRLLTEHLNQESQTAELDEQIRVLEQYPEELLIPLMGV